MDNARAVQQPKPDLAFLMEVGKTVGLWTLVEETKVGRERGFVCRCSCGTQRNVRRSYLVSGASRSCGCVTKRIHRTNYAANLSNRSIKNNNKEDGHVETEKEERLRRPGQVGGG